MNYSISDISNIYKNNCSLFHLYHAVQLNEALFKGARGYISHITGTWRQLFHRHTQTISSFVQCTSCSA